MKRKPSPTAYLLLGVGLVLTLVSGVLVQKAVDGYRELRLQSYSNEIEDYIHFRFQNYVNTLVQTAAFFSAVPAPATNVFATYSSAFLKLENYPGLEGLGFCQNFNASADLNKIDRCIISYRVPMNEKNRRALGMNITTEEARLETLQVARDTGMPTATPMINLIQDKMDGLAVSTPKNFIIFIPVFKAERLTNTVQERRAALQGFVYSPFKAQLLFSSIFKKAAIPQYAVTFRLYEGNDAQNEKLIFRFPQDASEESFAESKNARSEVRRVFSIAGRNWTLLVNPGAQYNVGLGHNLPILVVVFNFILCLLIFWLKNSNEREKFSRQAAEKSVLIRDEFLSIASHELKTPLTPLSLQLEILRTAINDTSGRFTRERMTLSIDTCIRSLKRLLKLVEDMLDVSKISNGKLRFEMETMNLSASVQDIVSRFANEITTSGSSLKLEIQENIIGVWDQFRIEQVIVNLVTNAVKYGGGKPIEIKLERHDDHARLTFIDHGIGIAPENQARIFNRFERVGSSSNIKGLGLGLYIVKMIVNGHHGQINVKSELGEGSTFTVDLPLDGKPYDVSEVALDLQKNVAPSGLTERQPL